MKMDVQKMMVLERINIVLLIFFRFVIGCLNQISSRGFHFFITTINVLHICEVCRRIIIGIRSALTGASIDIEIGRVVYDKYFQLKCTYKKRRRLYPAESSGILTVFFHHYLF